MYIKQGDLFRGVSISFLTKAMILAQRGSCPEDAILFQRGEPAAFFFVLINGSVELSVGEADRPVHVGCRTGESFGWAALVGRDCYPATARCLSKIDFLRIRVDDFKALLNHHLEDALVFYRNLSAALSGRLMQRYLGELPAARKAGPPQEIGAAERESLESALSGCEFFEGLGRGDLEKIVLLCREREFQTGETVFRQGDYGEHLYVIVQGQVSLERTIDLGARKGQVTIETLEKGRVLGSWSTLLALPHRLMSTAVCQKPTRLAVMPGAALRSLMLAQKDLGFNVMEKFCFLLRDRVQAAYGAMEKI
ncbi:MAG: cyclic nucleotide-binding domain-containing protein [Desulfobacteraceae bacterium]|jgi:CRP-like cAMP-binding protein|nr:cyclic nucleotide-binding domain-containing protein [Desulfobacteraceae bacterium]